MSFNFFILPCPLSARDSDDDEEEDDEVETAANDQPKADNQDGETSVKVEGGSEPTSEQKPAPRKSKPGAPHELRIFLPDELRKMKRDELVAETEYLDGAFTKPFND